MEVGGVREGRKGTIWAGEDNKGQEHTPEAQLKLSPASFHHDGELKGRRVEAKHLLKGDGLRIINDSPIMGER